MNDSEDKVDLSDLEIIIVIRSSSANLKGLIRIGNSVEAGLLDLIESVKIARVEDTMTSKKALGKTLSTLSVKWASFK